MMKILPINTTQFNTNSPQKINKAQKNSPISNYANPTFGNYKEVLTKSFDRALYDKWDMGRLFQDLFDSAQRALGAITTERGHYYLINSLVSRFSTMASSLGMARIKSAEELFFSSDVLIKLFDDPIVTRFENIIEFSHPEVNGSVEFWISKLNGDFYIKRPNLKEGFYSDEKGGPRETTVYTDWCTPTTTYYNRDGSEKKLRSFFGSMGF